MFHLFNRVYLEHEQWYATQLEHLIINTTECDHPVSRLAGMKIGQILSFEDYLKTTHEGSIDKFWNHLLAMPKDKDFIVYADQKLFDELQIQYWKSIFEKISNDDLYKLYNFYFIDKKLKRFIDLENKTPIPNGDERTVALTREEFEEIASKISSSDSLALMDKFDVSFEYLLANYYLAPGSENADAFLKKLEELSWKSFFDNADILRSEILNSFYDIKKIIPTAAVDFNNLKSIEDFIMSEPRLRWITDERFHERNKNYVLKNYSKDIFLEVTFKMNKSLILNPNLTQQEIEKYLEQEDQIQLIKCVFEKRYKDLLEMSVRKGFGCIFVGDDLSTKANQILPLFIYEKIRENRLSELNFLRLA